MARFAIYGETRLPVNEETPLREVRDSFSRFYPELGNSEPYLDEEGNIRFRTTGGSKGC